MNITIASGKGGTGKTLVATNLAAIWSAAGREVTYLDCDVEAPNGHLFLKPRIEKEEEIEILSPVGTDPDKCTKCGLCAKACTYNAIAVTPKEVIIFPGLCHVCGACTIVCSEDAIIEKVKKIGQLSHGSRPFSRDDGAVMDYHYALLETGEGGMSPRLIARVKEFSGSDITINDSPPGTACSAVETAVDADLVVLVTDPTPFGINDLKLAVEMCRKIGQEPVVLVNRAEYRDNSLQEYCREAELDVIGEIPDDRAIAEVYSSGGLVVDELPKYRPLFEKIIVRIKRVAAEERGVKPVPEIDASVDPSPSLPELYQPSDVPRPRELVVISGKGGTGKTSLTASFAALADKCVISDCDVDAADLHLILKPEVRERGFFSGGVVAKIDQDRCVSCGRCFEECRFNAIDKDGEEGESITYRIDPLSCEGCGVCALVCPVEAVLTEPAINGEWFVSRTRFDQPMTHAKLGIAEENSGRLVTVIREKAVDLAMEKLWGKVIIDGSPGTGCPVIASLTGAAYALIVTEPTVSGVHDLKRILDLTRHFRVPSGVVINKYDLNQEMAEEIISMAGEYQAELIGKIPYDRVVTDAQMEGLSVVEYSDGSVTESITKIWEKLTQQNALI
ncbi:MAG TPA: 4Fe-4S dicluster domain-containing protein [Proteobacteria bacterium]|nr:4Fe-4S dicluster domain-containing protein [Pseudomonadota bacterium]